MLTVSFAPCNFWFVALFSLTPLTVCVIRRPLSWRWLLMYELAGTIYFFINLFWLHDITWPASYDGALLALAAYLGLFILLFTIGVQRLMVHLRWPGMLAVPLVWVTAEYLRSTLLTGFPWFIMGNSLSPALPLIQIADLAGVWGVSFFIGLTSGWLVDVLRLPLRKGGKTNPAIVRLNMVYGAVVIGVVAYGLFRLHQDTFSDGPKIAVIQKYVPQDLKDESATDPELKRIIDEFDHAKMNEEKDRLWLEYERRSQIVAPAFYSDKKKKIFDPYMQLSIQAAQQKPDLIVWPETMVPGPLNLQWLKRAADNLDAWDRALQKMSQDCDHELTQLSSTTHANLLIGADGKFAYAKADGKQDERDQNLAIAYAPDSGQQPGTYAKRHLVPFGEFVPFKESWPWLHKVLQGFTPYPDREYGVAAGEEWFRFHMMTNDGRTYNFSTPICYEDTMPEPSRCFVDPVNGHKQVDFLLSISNDGWYRSLAELGQHLQIDQLRAVENRISFARAVNGGNSGFINPNGRIIATVQTNPTFGGDGFALQTIPLDTRITLYSRLGDLFPILCGILCVLAIAWSIVRPRRAPFSGRPTGDQ